ncbi:hypothetical protein GCM10019059_41630 [Camelimonas fluminis]|uniref:Outer membrane beta-barrel protein n=1 Tax=Camelimonas fluminis TaxID=1576911 RepID=A0ABV7UN06_9HYPH|nr:outer membrane beta-barrel protein [Camelimonas fluminis]GHE78528.1 hypothetical protein GCM10019059_41630 [Camelimonas fluminis]
MAEPLQTPAFGGLLKANDNPFTLDAGGLGQFHISGQLTGLAFRQTNAIPYSRPTNTGSLADISNAQIQVQTTGTPIQFYVQGGLYALPSLGASYMRAVDATDKLYGPVPIAYGKLQATPELSIQAGLLQTLIGAESTFTFQNMNIARGLLWNQEPAISRGVQANYTKGSFSASISLNDGFYSGKLNWISALASWTISPAHTISVVAAGNLGETARTSLATPLAQNNSSIFNLIYAYSSGPLTVSPYLQYTRVSANRAIGVSRTAETFGAALLARYTFTDTFSLAGRAEYITSWGADCGIRPECAPTNLLYGPGSRAWSLTITPTYQHGVFFARAEASYTRIDGMEDGYGFGRNFDRRDQARGMIEAGVLF